MQKLNNPVLDWGWKHLIPKTWPAIVWTFFVLFSLVGSYYYFKAGTGTPYREKVVFENPLKYPARIIPAKLDLGESLFSGKKAISVEISVKDFDEKKFPLIFMETDAANLALCFWGIDDQGIFHFSRFSVDSKDRAFLEITNVSFSPDFRKMEIGYAVNMELLLRVWFIGMLYLSVIALLFAWLNIFMKIRDYGKSLAEWKKERKNT